MISLKYLCERVHKINKAREPQERVTRIYLPDDEYEAIMREARGLRTTLNDSGEEFRAAPAWAVCYRLSEMAHVEWARFQ